MADIDKLHVTIGKRGPKVVEPKPAKARFSTVDIIGIGFVIGMWIGVALDRLGAI